MRATYQQKTKTKKNYWVPFNNGKSFFGILFWPLWELKKKKVLDNINFFFFFWEEDNINLTHDFWHIS